MLHHERSQKGEAIVKSSFSEVLYLDSDNVVLADPAFLFDSPVYKEHRAVFWPDITRDVGPDLQVSICSR